LRNKYVWFRSRIQFILPSLSTNWCISDYSVHVEKVELACNFVKFTPQCTCISAVGTSPRVLNHHLYTYIHHTSQLRVCMFNMLGRTAIIALRFEYFMGSVIHVHQAVKQAASACTDRFTPICVITNVSVNPSIAWN